VAKRGHAAVPAAAPRERRPPGGDGATGSAGSTGVAAHDAVADTSRPPRMANDVRHATTAMPALPTFARHAGLTLLFVGAALAGTASGVLFAYSDDLPAISALDQYQPDTITRVVGRDGSIVGEFATERRVVLRYDEIPPVMRQAVLSAEDSGFFEHFGFSITGLVRAVVTNVIEMRKAGGASTLTQQLARKLFLTDEKTWERKVKELLLSVQIEKRYTKEEIFTLYCNQMYFGHGAYGVEAAAQIYFGKPVKYLAVEEAAMIAGILQGNARQSPYVNMNAALRRRNYTLDRMATEGYIPAADARRPRHGRS
jgi:penicillin-binding protein 1A